MAPKKNDENTAKKTPKKRAVKPKVEKPKLKTPSILKLRVSAVPRGKCKTVYSAVSSLRTNLIYRIFSAIHLLLALKMTVTGTGIQLYQYLCMLSGRHQDDFVMDMP